MFIFRLDVIIYALLSFLLPLPLLTSICIIAVIWFFLVQEGQRSSGIQHAFKAGMQNPISWIEEKGDNGAYNKPSVTEEQQTPSKLVKNNF